MKSQRSFPLLATLILAVVVGAAYFPIFLGKVPIPIDKVLQFPPWENYVRAQASQETADIGDLVTFFYPLRSFAADAVKKGTLPLWNPYILAGAPFQANAQSALFYPATWLYFLFPMTTAWTIHLSLRTFLSALFMTLFARSIGASKTGAILSGMVFSLCGFMSVWQGAAMADAAIWLPVICYAVYRLHQERSGFALALAAVAFALPVLAGHPETAAHLTLAGTFTALGLWLFPVRAGTNRFDLRFIVCFTLAGLLAMGLASIQMIPTVEWLTHISAPLGGSWPPFRGHQIMALFSRDIFSSPNSADLPIPETAAYIGMMTLLAASVAAFHSSKRLVAILSLLTFVALCAVYGVWPVYWLISHLPVLGSIKNGRLILVATFGLASLAGLGVTALQQEDWPRSRRRNAFLMLSLAFLMSLLLVHRLQRATHMKPDFIHRPSFSRSLLLLSVIPLAWRLKGGLRGSAFPILVCALAGFDLVTFSYGATSFVPRQAVFPHAPVFDFLAKTNDPAQFRIAEFGGTYASNAQVVYGIPAADGFEILLNDLHIFTTDIAENRPEAISFIEDEVLKSQDRRLDLLNVKYLVENTYVPAFEKISARFPMVFRSGSVYVFENKSVLPRAFAVPATGIEVIKGDEGQLRRLQSPSFNPEQSVILGERPAALTGPYLPAMSSTSVQIIDSQVNQIRMRAQAGMPAVLIVSQIYYPGWKAFVDGQEASVFPADLALTGLALPSGTHDVQLVFQPASFRIGAGITIVSLMVIVGIFVVSGRRRFSR